MSIRSVESFTIVFGLGWAINNIAKVEQKCRIQSSRVRVIIGRNVLRDFLGVVRMTDAAVAKRVESQLANCLDLLNGFRTNNIGKGHARVPAWRGNRPKL